MDMRSMSLSRGGDRLWSQDTKEFDLALRELKFYLSSSLKTPRDARARGIDAISLVDDMQPVLELLMKMAESLQMMWGDAQNASLLSEKTSRLQGCKTRLDLLTSQLDWAQDHAALLRSYTMDFPDSTKSPGAVLAGIQGVEKSLAVCRQRMTEHSSQQGGQQEGAQQQGSSSSSSARQPIHYLLDEQDLQQRRFQEAHQQETVHLPPFGVPRHGEADTGGSPSRSRRQGYRPPTHYSMADDSDAEGVDLEQGFQVINEVELDFDFEQEQMRRDQTRRVCQEASILQSTYATVAQLVQGQQANFDSIEESMQMAVSYANMGKDELEKAYERRSKRAACLAITLGCLLLPWVVNHIL